MQRRLVLLLAFLAACHSGPPTSPDEAASVVLTTNFTELFVGDGPLLVAPIRNSDGELLPKAVVEWRTDNPAVAAIDSSGRLRGITPGTVRVTVASGGFADSKTLTAGALPWCETANSGLSACPARRIRSESGIFAGALSPVSLGVDRVGNPPVMSTFTG